MTTLTKLHRDAVDMLRDVSDSARLDAELLIAHTLNIPRTRFITDPDTPIDATQLNAINQQLQQRRHGYPIAYLLGKKHFWDLELTVTPDTLIPRPETELLVEQALACFPAEQSIRVADLGTGTGAIAIAIARARPRWQMLATDRFLPTLQVAQDNAQHYALDNIEFLHSNWFDAFTREQPFDMLISNPPYIRDDDPHLTQGDIRYEPQHALRAGEDGLQDIRHIISHAPACLAENGWLLLEHGYDQASAVRALFEQHRYAAITQKTDLAGHVRITMGQYANGR